MVEFADFQNKSINRIHKKTVTAVSIDSSGSRCVTGSLDSYFKMWDFHGMKKKTTYFRKISPESGIPINFIKWDTTGNKFIVCPASSSAKIYDRDGDELGFTPKGDMYIKDLNNTKGHVSHINGSLWGKDKNTLLTWSNDCTVRQWDITNLKNNANVFKLKSKNNKKFGCSYAALNKKNALFTGSYDGCLNIFDLRYPHRPVVLNNAHSKNSPINGILIGEHYYYSKSTDGTVKKWDLRNNKLVKTQNIWNENINSNMIFSPNKTHILMPSYNETNLQNSEIVFLDVEDFEISKSLKIKDQIAVCLDWNKKINQIFVGTNKRNLLAFYDEKKSKNGIMLCDSKNEYLESEEDVLCYYDKKMIRDAQEENKQI